MTIQEIIKKAKSKNNEDMYFELKETSKFINPIKKLILKPLHESIVAFANKEGGRVIIGILSDGAPEGKGIFDDLGDEKQSGIDKFMNAILDSCQYAISPQINIALNYHQNDDYEFIEVVVPKRNDMPHAVVERGNEYYEEKFYYLRSSNTNHLVCPVILK